MIYDEYELYEISTVKGEKYIHLFGYVYEADCGTIEKPFANWRNLSYIGVFMPVKEFLAITHSGTMLIEDVSDVKIELGEITEAEANEICSAENYIPLSFDKLSEKTPDGFYVNYEEEETEDRAEILLRNIITEFNDCFLTPNETVKAMERAGFTNSEIIAYGFQPDNGYNSDIIGVVFSLMVNIIGDPEVVTRLLYRNGRLSPIAKDIAAIIREKADVDEEIPEDICKNAIITALTKQGLFRMEDI